MKDFDELVGKTFNFYGCVADCFKLGRDVWQAEEDDSDGYRSSLGSVNQIKMDKVPKSKDKFAKRSLAKVRVEAINNRTPGRKSSDPLVNVDSGYRLVDVKTGKVWLEFGTDNEDDYYPAYIFNPAK